MTLSVAKVWHLGNGTPRSRGRPSDVASRCRMNPAFPRRQALPYRLSGTNFHWPLGRKSRIFRPAMTTLRLTAAFALNLILFAALKSSSAPFDPRGIQFIPIKSFSPFARSLDATTGAAVLTSPEMQTRIRWDELIVSWNAEMPAGASLKIEARAIYPDHATKWFTMGLWSTDPAKHPRTSVRGQQDDDGSVETDTLALKQRVERVQLRVKFGADGKKKPKLKFLSLSLLDRETAPAPLAPNHAAWGKTINVPERSQMAYENGIALCSPTTISMLLAYWSQRLNRPGLDQDVPEVAKGVYDPQWGGTGNWVFNTAYAGSFRGLRAYTARLSAVSELEDFIARGIPVGLSVCYNRLRGKSREPSGHIVVCVGFTKQGDVIVNDPGTSKNVRKVFPRANLLDAWAYSKNSVYLVYPVNTLLPKDRSGHWESPTTKRGIAFKVP
jgi:hypothetical protein